LPPGLGPAWSVIAAGVFRIEVLDPRISRVFLPSKDYPGPGLPNRKGAPDWPGPKNDRL